MNNVRKIDSSQIKGDITLGTFVVTNDNDQVIVYVFNEGTDNHKLFSNVGELVKHLPDKNGFYVAHKTRTELTRSLWQLEI